ncbi:MAG TPA: hypothetical protein VMP67_05240, partial [Candidatus Limnocylindria bacterium]|nr:hypothetical protein [Candidatus Limnocylindria bacterium]
MKLAADEIQRRAVQASTSQNLHGLACPLQVAQPDRAASGHGRSVGRVERRTAGHRDPVAVRLIELAIYQRLPPAQVVHGHF